MAECVGELAILNDSDQWAIFGDRKNKRLHKSILLKTIISIANHMGLSVIWE